MNSINCFWPYILFIIGTLFEFVLNQSLEFYLYIHRKHHCADIPAELMDYIDAEKIIQACEYRNEKYSLWVVRNIAETFLSLMIIQFFFSQIFFLSHTISNNVFFAVMLFIILLQSIGFFAGLPFDIYNEFKIEKKFGFSKITIQEWIHDLIKSIVLAFIIGAIITGVCIGLLSVSKHWWWMLGIFYVVFSLAVSFVYPMFIAPIFNKFSPLEEGELKTRLENLLRKTRFKATGIFVMDASRRSSHSNAYFTGIGKSKRIVLYDTLIRSLSPAEIEAVLAHELGHYEKNHIIKKLAATIPCIFLVLFVASKLIWNIDIYLSFGLIPNETQAISDVFASKVIPTGWKDFIIYMQVAGIMLLAEIFKGFSPLVNLVSNTFSRKHEFQADKFAKELCGTEKNLVTALIKLNKENLNDFTPPKLYCIFNYSHPPMIERIKALKKEDKEDEK